MSFRIVVDEVADERVEGVEPTPITRYTQTVEELDLLRLIAAVNAKPRKVRVRKSKVAESPVLT